MSKLRVLFVDDEPLVLQGLRRMLRPLEGVWEMAFAKGGPEALAMLAQAPFDVLVTDMRMPGMDGVTLLSEVKRRYPQIARLILSGQMSQDLVFKSVTLAHQYLTKPCEAGALKAAVDRLLRLRPLLTEPAVLEVVAGIDSLPSLPSLYAELVQETLSPYASAARLGGIISRDVGMTAKILQLVNSSFFGIRRQVNSPAEAVQWLGVETIKTLVLTCEVFKSFNCNKVPGFSLPSLWEHSLATGRAARLIAAQENLEKSAVEQSFMAGMLHDVGKLLLAANFAPRYEEVLALCRTKKLTPWEAEREIFGISHAEVGGYLLGLWGLPDNLVEAVAYHHQPDRSETRGFTPLTAVHVANAFIKKPQEPAAEASQFAWDETYLSRLQMLDRLPYWQALCQDTCET